MCQISKIKVETNESQMLTGTCVPEIKKLKNTQTKNEIYYTIILAKKCKVNVWQQTNTIHNKKCAVVV